MLREKHIIVESGAKNVFLNSNTVALLEAIYPSAAVNQLLSASEERMALAADFDLELTLGRAGNEGLTASAAYHCFAIRRMNIFLHVLSLLCRVMHYHRTLYHRNEKKQAVFLNFQIFFNSEDELRRGKVFPPLHALQRANGSLGSGFYCPYRFWAPVMEYPLFS